MKYMVFLFIALLLLSACSTSYYIPECDAMKTQGERDVCYNNAAVINHDFRYCDKISTKEKQDWCVKMIERAIGSRKKGLFG
jgi:hypothetical protein